MVGGGDSVLTEARLFFSALCFVFYPIFVIFSGSVCKKYNSDREIEVKIFLKCML